MATRTPNAAPAQGENLTELMQSSDFIHRHIGPNPTGIKQMLEAIGFDSLDELVRRAIPSGILSDTPLALPRSRTERDVLGYLRKLAASNQVFTSMIGLGYSNSITPPVILRNILESPGWYTAYTPYQSEISQGRLEALLNFQTMVTDLTGMEIANASMLDEATAAAEAMAMCHSLAGSAERNTFWVSEQCYPQTIDVVRTRARPLGIKVVLGDHNRPELDDSFFAVLLQYPAANGRLDDYSGLCRKIHDNQSMVIVAADILSLTLLTPPGEFGADVVVGSTQRFGVPLGFGGPHAAYFATSADHKRNIPGRLVGLSRDAQGNPALRLALQTREQHIRRERATSNICTAQVLLAVMASMYAVYHGPRRLKTIAQRVHRLTAVLAEGLLRVGFEPVHESFFDTLEVRCDEEQQRLILEGARAHDINLRPIERDGVGISLDETTAVEDIETLWSIFGKVSGLLQRPSVEELEGEVSNRIPEDLRRTSPFLTHPVFNTHHSETEMLRYMHRLQEKDISLTHSMIPLGSCTMKLNASAEMLSITEPGFADIHPFVPLEQVPGYLKLIHELETMLAEITGFARVSVQPNAGSQGEYAGLLVIQKFQETRGQGHRDICLIPSSAHGTNPASAAMAGLKVVVVACDAQGNVDIESLRSKAEEHRDRLAALMITYPSTHGVFEEGIRDICQIVHDNGGQVYMDGANLNALVGLCRPGSFGPDVAHLNLHKTFCIPHGGGGPGVGPIGVGAHLAPFLPTHSLVPEAGPETGISAVAAAPWGSAGILPISWAYIALMGRDGLKKATQTAILNANYISGRLADHYNVLFKGKNGLVAHECIVDLRPLQNSAGVDVTDVAKRLIDYGFHAPTMSWPVPGTLMIEPTESESKEELDRFCEAMIAIRNEIRQIEKGEMEAARSPLKNAPHTAADLVREPWDLPYSRETAVFPLPWVRERKFWSPVNRVDNAYGDRNLMCTCPPIESYE